jgi:hypothetical protein
MIRGPESKTFPQGHPSPRPAGWPGQRVVLVAKRHKERIWAALVAECDELGGVPWEWRAADGWLGKARFGGDHYQFLADGDDNAEVRAASR